MTRFAVNNPVTTLVVAFILLLAGLIAYLKMPSESFPEIKIPLIFVTTIYPGASPGNIETIVTQKIEDQLKGMDGVKKITSQSEEGVSLIQVEFSPDVVVETALRRVKDKVDAAQGDLPPDVEDPIVQELNFSSIPVFIISLSSDYEIDRLEYIAENLKRDLQKINGVLEVKITGKQEREIAVDVNTDKLEQYHLTLHDIADAISAQHANIPGGTLSAGGNRFTLAMTGEIKDPQKFGDLVIRSEGNSLVRVRDVANVQFTYSRDRSSIARLNGKPSLAITITKRTGENIIRIVDEAKAKVEEAKELWPVGTHAEYSMDQSTEIRHMVNELRNHIIMGLILVVLLLSYFLGLRNSFFISTAIPFSMMMGFLVLSSMNVTLNMVVLFSLVIALGMLVDDGIVVVENIYRHLGMGKTRIQAAIDGTREVMVPVTTATITSVAAFIPILWMPGIMGQFMKYLPITVIVTLTGSLFVAFVFNPVFASLFMNQKDASKMEEGHSDNFEGARKSYARTLGFWIDHPVWVGLFGLFFVVSGIVAYGFLGRGVEFFPNVEPKVIAAEVEGPLGTSIHTTDSALSVIEKKILKMPESVGDIDIVSAVTGMGKPDDMGASRSAESHKGYIDLAFTEFEHREVSSWGTLKWLEDSLPTLLPGWKLTIKKQNEGPPQGHPISLEVIGDDFETLSSVADSLRQMLMGFSDLRNVGWDYEPAKPEIRIDVNRDMAKRLGVSSSQAAMAVRSAIYGIEAGKFRQGDEEHKIMVRLAPGTREDLMGLDRVVVNNKDQSTPLSSIATFKQGASLSSIKHLDGQRTIQVWAEMSPGVANEQKSKTDVYAAVAKVKSPPGYTVRPGTSNRDQEETQAFLGLAFLIAVALVFLTMVFQFNSVFQPLLVVGSILLSIGGVFWGLLITDRLIPFQSVKFSIIMSGIGIIALAGVVAKNSIVLIDFINKLREQGESLREAVIEGGRTRLRPVILTAVTAMIGLVPMATGAGIDFTHLKIVLRSETSQWWSPMAWAIFWGLLFNTALTLVVVPTFYYNWELFKAWIAGKWKKETV